MRTISERALGLAAAEPVGRDHAMAVAVTQGIFLAIESQVGLARPFVRPVAGEAVIGKDGTDVAVEFDERRRRRISASDHAGQHQGQKRR